MSQNVFNSPQIIIKHDHQLKGMRATKPPSICLNPIRSSRRYFSMLGLMIALPLLWMPFPVTISYLAQVLPLCVHRAKWSRLPFLPKSEMWSIMLSKISRASSSKNPWKSILVSSLSSRNFLISLFFDSNLSLFS